jgi:peptide/nickel transport system ATP-binding protein
MRTVGGEAGDPIFELKDVWKTYRGGGTRSLVSGQVSAVAGVNLSITKGEALGLVGESGSGKSTLGRILAGLIPPTAGTVTYRGRDLRTWGKGLHSEVQVIFQNPHGSLNPRMTVGATLVEVLRVRRRLARVEAATEMRSLLDRVGLPRDFDKRYPTELSGGECQRVAIARAIAVKPQVIVADEVVTALDLAIQARILNLLVDLRRELGLTYVFITHDIGLLAGMCERVAVMLQGKIVEIGPTEQIIAAPSEEYTQKLVSSRLRTIERLRSQPENAVEHAR